MSAIKNYYNMHLHVFWSWLLTLEKKLKMTLWHLTKATQNTHHFAYSH